MAEDEFSHILIKEVVHHFTDRLHVFQGLHRRLTLSSNVSETPTLVIVTRPKHPSYPLFAAAKDLFAEHQPSEEEIVADLRQAGFARVTVQYPSFPLPIPRQRWLDMLRGRFWSTLSHFDDAALERGIAEVAHATADTPVIVFDDSLVLITAHPA